MSVTLFVALSFGASIVSGNGQVLDLTGGTIQGSLLDQELVGISGGPPAFLVSDVGVNNGMISTWVVYDSSLDGSGDLFIYQVVNNGPSAVDNVELTGFTGSEVLSIGTYSALGGSLSLSDSEAPSSNGSFPPASESTFGGTATFEGGDLPNGSTPSYFLVVDTDVNLNSFSESYGQIQDGFSAQGNILAPAPEPSSLILLLAGLACLYGVFTSSPRELNR